MTALFTVAELSRQAGMAPRTIRAYQSRELLEPPARRGRTAYYSAGHLQRLRQITSLQRQGFNLVAIGAILKSREKPAASVRRLAEEHPHLADAIARVDRLAEELVRATHSRPGQARLLTEAFRLAVERSERMLTGECVVSPDPDDI